MANQPSLADWQYARYGGRSIVTSGNTIEDLIVPVTEVPGGYVSVQFSGTFTMDFSFEQSNDGSAWEPCYLYRLDSAPPHAATAAITGTTAQSYGGVVQLRYFRVRISADTSGTVTAAAWFPMSIPPLTTTMSSSTSSVTASTTESRPSSAAITSVGDSATSITVLAANAARKGASFQNLSGAALSLNLAGTTAIIATAASVALAATTGYFELPQPCYTGLITGIWASDAGGVVNVTEWS